MYTNVKVNIIITITITIAIIIIVVVIPIPNAPLKVVLGWTRCTQPYFQYWRSCFIHLANGPSPLKFESNYACKNEAYTRLTYTKVKCVVHVL